MEKIKNLLNRIKINSLNLLILLIISFLFFTNSKIYSQCLQIESILVDACDGGNPLNEGKNEIIRIKIGSTPININDIRIDGNSGNSGMLLGKSPNNYNNFLGWAPYGAVAAKVATLNASITSCGRLIEPIGGIIPANKRVIIFTSTDFDPTLTSFANLTDTLYIVFQTAGNTNGHFDNYGTTGSVLKTLQLTHVPTGCNDMVTYNKSLLVNTSGLNAAENGAGVNFAINGDASYYNNGCHAPIFNNAAWNSPNIVCDFSDSINLNDSVHGLTGGTWSGTGITGSVFNPSGLNGIYNITYTVGVTPCQMSETHTIRVINEFSTDWVEPALPICINQLPIDLNSLILPTGLIGGNWSWGASNSNMFNPTNTGSYQVVYTHSNLLCATSESHDIEVVDSLNAFWAAPDTICQNSPTIDLNTLLYPTAITGGTWTINGVQGSTFNPSLYSGNITISYNVGTPPCTGSQTSIVFIIESAISTWIVPQPLCQNTPAIDLNNLLAINATTGGVWSGNGVLDNFFNPLGIIDSSLVSYTVGTEPCIITESHYIKVLPNYSADWLTPNAMCENSNPIELNTLLSSTSTTGGLWSGNGVENSNIFNPIGLSGLIDITYTVGTSPCEAIQLHQIEVLPIPVASFSINPSEGIAPLPVLFSNTSIDANSYLWDFGTGEFSSENSPTYTYDNDGIYFVMLRAYSGNGCADSIVNKIVVSEPDIYIPNAFSPNNDDINEYFSLNIYGVIDNYKLLIYNRFGEIVYSSNNQFGKWDGKYNGEIVPQGVYYYIVTYTKKEVDKKIHGSITLIK